MVQVLTFRRTLLKSLRHSDLQKVVFFYRGKKKLLIVRTPRALIISCQGAVAGISLDQSWLVASCFNYEKFLGLSESMWVSSC